jgi:hypothetical protein
MPSSQSKYAQLPLVSRAKEAISYVKKHGGDAVGHIAQTMVDDAPEVDLDEDAILMRLFGDRTQDVRRGHGQAVHDVLKKIADDLGIVVTYKRNDDMAAKHKRVLSDVYRVFQSKLAEVIAPIKIHGMRGMEAELYNYFSDGDLFNAMHGEGVIEEHTCHFSAGR